MSATSAHSLRRALLAGLAVQPDPFQVRALDALDQGRSVLVTAPTGAGKTLVADYAIARVLQGRTGEDAPGTGAAVYTTPLKALSNQKYREFAARLGAGRVGLITGDRVVNAGAPVLVMTTEVLRAMLYDTPAAFGSTRKSIGGRRLGAVVLDEFHYLQDPERGSAWEEVVIHLPAGVQLVCLSATIPDAAVVRDWLAAVHGPTSLVTAEQRPVELHHLYAVGNLRGNPPLLLPMHVDGRLNHAAELLDGVRHETRGEGRRIRDRDRPVPPARAALLARLAESDLLPAIWFVFSRHGCDEAVTALLADGVRLTSEAEASQIRALVASALAALDAGAWRAIGAESWRRGLEAGIAAHHGGLAPVQREVVEEAFAQGLLKVAFATETLALGVNLPARTVVIDRTVRPGGEVISAAEFAQLAGRAGRRGTDATGHVVVPWSPQVSFQRVSSLIGGQLAALRSEFRVTPAMAANLVRLTPDISHARETVESSLRHWLNMARVSALRADLEERNAELAELPELAELVGAAGSEAPGAGTAPHADRDPAPDEVRIVVERDLAATRPGDVVLDPSRVAAGPVVVLAVGRKRGLVCVDAVRADGRRLQLTPRSMRARPVVVGRIDLDTWVRTERGHARRAADALAEFEVPALPAGPAEPAGRPRKRKAGRGHERERLTKSVRRLERLVAETEGAVGGELEAVVRLLHRRGHLTGWALTPSGEIVRKLFHPSGLLLAESLAAGVLDGLDPPSVASVASWFTVRTPLGGPRPTGFATAEVATAYERVRDLTRSVLSDEASEGLGPTPYPEPALGVPVYRWASGRPLDAALAGTDVRVGDLVREVRQVAELLEQIMAVPGGHREAAAEAVVALRRGVAVSV